ncbi:hypothetical protein GPECTOR_90g541 [Gonium pectorale]|uniref:Uncharacterized protein n=1 Tax=Gonium pectorale TaxID=33097 RepID=A0A150G0U0_GONPE|nr:hypothetical protein GPECTOR_90g541 [Gonium pectorale]|eukprot:KXZ43454.1 hypothetical protein GPECTOR_90g541 [Gonium pectorale]
MGTSTPGPERGAQLQAPPDVAAQGSGEARTRNGGARSREPGVPGRAATRAASAHNNNPWAANGPAAGLSADSTAAEDEPTAGTSAEEAPHAAAGGQHAAAGASGPLSLAAMIAAVDNEKSSLVQDQAPALQVPVELAAGAHDRSTPGSASQEAAPLVRPGVDDDGPGPSGSAAQQDRRTQPRLQQPTKGSTAATALPTIAAQQRLTSGGPAAPCAGSPFEDAAGRGPGEQGSGDGSALTGGQDVLRPTPAYDAADLSRRAANPNPARGGVATGAGSLVEVGASRQRGHAGGAAALDEPAGTGPRQAASRASGKRKARPQGGDEMPDEAQEALLQPRGDGRVAFFIGNSTEYYRGLSPLFEALQKLLKEQRAKLNRSVLLQKLMCFSNSAKDWVVGEPELVIFEPVDMGDAPLRLELIITPNKKYSKRVALRCTEGVMCEQQLRRLAACVLANEGKAMVAFAGGEGHQFKMWMLADGSEQEGVQPTLVTP